MLKRLLYFSCLCLFVCATAGTAKADTIHFGNTNGCSKNCGSQDHFNLNHPDDNSGQFTTSFNCTRNCGGQNNPQQDSFQNEDQHSYANLCFGITDQNFAYDCFKESWNNNGNDCPGGQPPVVPEPSSLLLLGTGLATLAGMFKLKAVA